jgi:hypothetical protein
MSTISKWLIPSYTAMLISNSNKTQWQIIKNKGCIKASSVSTLDVGNASTVFAEIEKVWGRKWFGLMKGIMRDLEDPRPFPVSIFFRARPSCYFLLSFIMSYF